MDINKELTYLEKRALVKFLTDCITHKSLANYRGVLPRQLLCAYTKLVRSIEEDKESISYMD